MQEITEESENNGHGLIACATCGFLFSDKKVVVIGGEILSAVSDPIC